MEPELLDLIDKNTLVWESRLSKTKIINWLNNFKGNKFDDVIEKDIALDLLKHFLYYSEKEIRYLCKQCYSLIKNTSILNNPNEYLNSNSTKINDEFLSNCRFSYIGKISESGSNLTMPFRQENGLRVESFFEPTNLTKDNINENYHYIFMDDFIGTGRTAYDFWEGQLKQIHEEHPDVNFICMALIALKRGADLVRDRTDFKLICPQILNENYRIFHETNNIFSDEKKRNLAKDMCYYYGCTLVQERDALGYCSSQALIGFHHNVPDNTIPIIWAENNWIPIFRRYPKYE